MIIFYIIKMVWNFLSFVFLNYWKFKLYHFVGGEGLISYDSWGFWITPLTHSFSLLKKNSTPAARIALASRKSHLLLIFAWNWVVREIDDCSTKFKQIDVFVFRKKPSILCHYFHLAKVKITGNRPLKKHQQQRLPLYGTNYIV